MSKITDTVPDVGILRFKIRISKTTRKYLVRLMIPADAQPILLDVAPNFFKRLTEEMKQIEADGYTPEAETPITLERRDFDNGYAPA